MGCGALSVAQRPIPLHLGSAESSVGRRCEIAKTAVRPHRVVIVIPDCQYFAGMGKGRKQRLVEAFVLQPAVGRGRTMKKSKFSDAQIAFILRRAEEGT